MNAITMKYLDANIFIYPLVYDDERSSLFKKILFDLINKKFVGFTSVLTWDEIVHILRKRRGIETSIIYGKKFLNLPCLNIIDANRPIISMAQKLISEYHLKPRDAIHAATAISRGCTEIISDDSDFDKIRELKRISPEKFKS